MTDDSAFKKQVRDRMAETGEKYTVARRILIEDASIRATLHRYMEPAGISRIEIGRAGDRVRVEIFTARPGIVIGPRGAEADRIRADLAEITGTRVGLYIFEVRGQELARPSTAGRVVLAAVGALAVGDDGIVDVLP